MAKTSMADERPMIELYMYSLNQEFPQNKGHSHFLKRHSEVKPGMDRELVGIEVAESQIFGGKTPKLPADWSVQWLENQWIENHTKAVGMGEDDYRDPMQDAILRHEDFGGILFEPATDRVFKLNKAGIALFEEMRAYLKPKGREIQSFASKSFDAEDVRHFAAYVEGAGLWIRR